jgi:hypothetical protein
MRKKWLPPLGFQNPGSPKCSRGGDDILNWSGRLMLGCSRAIWRLKSRAFCNDMAQCYRKCPLIRSSSLRLLICDNPSYEKSFTMQILKSIRSIVSLSVRTALLRANYYLGNYDEVIWLIGCGRSGSTWVADLISHSSKSRQIVEPFHPYGMREMSFLTPHQYLRPDDVDRKLESAASRVFSGKLTHPSVDWNVSSDRRFLYNGLIVKDIFANLFSKWASCRFPRVKTVLLIRNPFAVALSQAKMSGSNWGTVKNLLGQPKLHNDYLHRFEDVIGRLDIENDVILSQVFMWSVINYVPLRQFRPEELHVIFYEKAFADPRGEIAALFQSLGKDSRLPVSRLDEATIVRPALLGSSTSTLRSGKSPISSWKDELTTRQIDAGMEILRAFGFGDLYDDDVMPRTDMLRCDAEAPERALP